MQQSIYLYSLVLEFCQVHIVLSINYCNNNMEVNKKVHKRISLYIPKNVYQIIDLKRADIPRSKFIQRIIEKHFNLEE